jgi:hypothetical protein
MIEGDTQFSWLRELAIPGFFTLLGAALGFIGSQIRDERKAKRDKQAFLRAIGMELDALGNQLDGSMQEVKGSTERVMGGSPTGPQFAAVLRTSVFTSQVAKLRDVDDPLLIAIVHFYSDLGTLQHILEMVNDLSAEFTRADVFSGQKDGVRPRLASSLLELQNQMTGFGRRLRELRSKLPSAEQTK